MGSKVEMLTPEQISNWYKEQHNNANRIIDNLLEDFQEDENVTRDLLELKRSVKAMNFFSK